MNSLQSELKLSSGNKSFFKWFLTIIILGAVLTVALHLSEEEDFVKIVQQANVYWLVLGIVLQAGTYVAQSLIWKIALESTGHFFKLKNLFGLSLGQLFINQTVPSASISGALFVSKVLARKKVSRSHISTVLGLSFISYFEAYALAAALAVVQLWVQGNIQKVMAIISLIIILMIGLSAFVLVNRISSVWMQRILEKLGLTRVDLKGLNFQLIIKGIFLQLTIFIFDFLTLWIMLRALGINANLGPVFASYMIAFIVKSFGIIPGGVGIFEAAAIASLHHAGVSVAGSLAATLLYRGLSYWLPMIPGLFLVRREFHSSKRVENYQVERFWQMPLTKLLEKLSCDTHGLSEVQVRDRLIHQGKNLIHERRGPSFLVIIWGQVKSPLVLLLLLAASVSLAVGDWINTSIILTILFIGTGIGSWRERQANNIIEKLKARLSLTSKVIRDGKSHIIAASNLVPGDIVLLSAGDLVPADLLILEAQDCYVNEAAITGESFPVIKSALPSIEKENVLFLGSSLQTGTAKCLVVNTGPATIFGKLVDSVQKAGPSTDFDRNLNSFGYMMLKVMTVIVMIVFAFKALTVGITIDSLMFSVALAVGLSPELLPLIINYDLAKGVERMAEKGLLVRHPKALENLAAVDILCSDKSGTITEGIVDFGGAFDDKGKPSLEVMKYAWINASMQTGMTNPLDKILSIQMSKIENHFRKVGEIPYDFKRKRLSVIVENDGRKLIITKGAFEKILEVCSENLDKENLKRWFEARSKEGARVLGLAIKEIPADSSNNHLLETEMTFIGFLVFLDRPKAEVITILNALKELGISLKIISGDNTQVTKAVALKVGIEVSQVIEGRDLDSISNEALPSIVNKTQIFTQVDPQQKERIITALRKTGHTVAYMGDGINDVSAMHAADVSISVDTAVDVAKSTADIVLMKKSLEFVKEGVREGRRTFHNSMKYINITMSANFGNMISMAIASIILPFLPLLAVQILLNNLLSDIPSLGLAEDNVDQELVSQPTKWDLKKLLNYMLVFGLTSSIFDLSLFYVLLKVFDVSIVEFRTAWFVESLLTQLFVIMILRTRKPITASQPSRLLMVLTIVVAIIAMLIPLIPGSSLLGFEALKPKIFLFIILITFTYLLTTEMVKRGLNKGALMRSFLIAMIVFSSFSTAFAKESSRSLDEMIHHHEKGIAKAKEMKKEGNNKEMTKLLDEMIVTQEKELRKMQDIQKRMYSSKKGMNEIVGVNEKFSDEVKQMEEEMNQVLSDFRSRVNKSSLVTNEPKVEVRENAKSYDVKIEVPGMTGNDVKVKVVNNELQIEGRREEEVKHENKEFTSTEFKYGEFQRSIHLAEKVVPDSMKLLHKDGVLTVHLDKAKRL